MEKDKRPLPLFDNQPSKRLLGELTDREGKFISLVPVLLDDSFQWQWSKVTTSQEKKNFPETVIFDQLFGMTFCLKGLK